MKKICLLSVLSFLCLTGCALHYDITTTNGNTYRSTSKPKLNERGDYVFKDGLGRDVAISRLKVIKIEAVNRGDPPSHDFN